MRTSTAVIVCICLSGTAYAQSVPGSEEAVPRYKPSSRSPAAMDIRSNVYGASRDAPNALQIGDRAPDFSAPRVGGGLVSLREARKQGPVVLIFYRGHW